MKRITTRPERSTVLLSLRGPRVLLNWRGAKCESAGTEHNAAQIVRAEFLSAEVEGSAATLAWGEVWRRSAVVVILWVCWRGAKHCPAGSVCSAANLAGIDCGSAGAVLAIAQLARFEVLLTSWGATVGLMMWGD